MKQKYLLFIVFCLFSLSNSFAQTNITAGNVSGPWTKANSPYKINGNITILDGDTLNIEDSVIVEFQGHYNLVVQGQLLAQGTKNDSIYFTVSDTTGFSDRTTTGGSWAGIIFDTIPSSNDTSKLTFCRLEYAKKSVQSNGFEGSGAAIGIFSTPKIRIENCVLTHNSSRGYGGALISSESSPIIQNCTFYKNYGTYGGAIYSRNHDFSSTQKPTIANNKIINNYADAYGGGIYIFEVSAIIVNNLIANNYAKNSGGGMFVDNIYNNLNIVNNTIANNQAANNGGGLYFNSVQCDNTNNILYGNTSSAGNQVYLYQSASVNFSYCDIQGDSYAFEGNGAYSGNYTNNINTDPKFSSPTAGSGTNYDAINSHWSIQSTTPCLNTATPDTTGLSLPLVDFAGNPRIKSNVRIDIGCYEFPNNPPEISKQTFSVNENLTEGAIACTIAAKDTDNDNLSFEILNENTNSTFTIDNSGTLKLATGKSIDYETLSPPSFSLDIKVTDNGSGNFTDHDTITINITDINDAPVFNPANFAINENSTVGTILGTVCATDEDSPAQTMNYAITGGTAQNYFTINFSSGQISVSDSSGLNYEVNPTMELIIKATDNGSPALNDTAKITIQLNDINDRPNIDNQSFSVSETSANSTIFGTVTASDPDTSPQTLYYTIVGGNDNLAFGIENNTGKLYVANTDSIDYEKAKSLILQVMVKDQGDLNDTADITINIENENDNSPILPDTTISINENPSYGTHILYLIPTDADSLSDITLKFQEGNTDTIFQISHHHDNVYTIFINKPDSVNYEKHKQFSFVVNASDGTYHTLSTITININNVNETPAIGNYSFDLNERTPNNTVVGQISGTDPDEGQTLHYYFTFGSNQGFGLSLDSVSGIITVIDSTQLDFETNPELDLQIEAIDNDTIWRLFSFGDAIFHIKDINEAPHIADQTFTIYENSDAGTNVGKVSASDEDAGQSVSLKIASGNENNIFSMDTTGQIKVAIGDSLDYENRKTYNLVIKASDNLSLSASANITIEVIDRDEPPVYTCADTFYVDENKANGTIIGTLSGSDPENDNLKFGRVNAETPPVPAFTISTSGDIVVHSSDSLNYERLYQPDWGKVKAFVYHVVMQDGHNAEVYKYIKLIVRDINEVPIVHESEFYFNENCADNTIADTVKAETDANETVTFSISRGNKNGIFGINAQSGGIFVVKGDSLNYEVKHYYEITVKATDDSPKHYSAESLEKIYIKDVNDAPVIEAQEFTFDVDNNTGNTIGRFEASDEDGDRLTCSIVGGNEKDFFILDNSKTLYVNDMDGLKNDTTTSYLLLVRVEDAEFSDSAYITINCTRSVSSSVNYFNPDRIVAIYPNPAKEFLNIDFKNNLGAINVNITDINGKILYRKQFIRSNKIDIHSIKAGIYFIHIRYRAKNYIKKIIIE